MGQFFLSPGTMSGVSGRFIGMSVSDFTGTPIQGRCRNRLVSSRNVLPHGNFKLCKYTFFFAIIQIKCFRGSFSFPSAPFRTPFPASANHQRIRQRTDPGKRLFVKSSRSEKILFPTPASTEMETLKNVKYNAKIQKTNRLQTSKYLTDYKTVTKMHPLLLPPYPSLYPRLIRN